MVRAETEVATPRTDVEEPVVFGTTAELQIVPCELHRVATQAAGADAVDGTIKLGNGQLPCFSEVPQPGDALLIGLSNAVPACAVVLRFDCPVRGPRHRPAEPAARLGGVERYGLEPSARSNATTPADSTARATSSCTSRPPTGPRSSPSSGPAGCAARSCQPRTTSPTYTATPEIAAIRAFTIGGTVGIVHAETIHDEVTRGLRRCARPAVRRCSAGPILPADRPAVLQVSDETADGGWVDWLPVTDFARSAEHDRHYQLDSVAGEVQFGPAVRQPDGALRQYGAIPPKGSTLRMSAYRVGGGSSGNVARGQVRVLKTSVPYVARVENRHPASGGVDGETVENAKLRGPLELRASGRAVTAEDFEELARTAAPDAARVRCVAAGEGRSAPAVRLLVVPKVTADSQGLLPDEELRRPPTELLQRIATHLDTCRLVGTRLLVGAARISRHHRGGPAQRPASGRADDVRRAAVRASTTISPRWPEDPRAPDGRSGGRCTPTSCPRCWPRSLVSAPSTRS